MSVAEAEAVPRMRLPLEGGGRCVRGLDGDHNAREFPDRRLSRWTHRVGVPRLRMRETPPLEAPP